MSEKTVSKLFEEKDLHSEWDEEEKIGKK